MSMFLNKILLKDMFKKFRHGFFRNVLLLNPNLIIHLALIQIRIRNNKI
jgi:hypothetical protein